MLIYLDASGALRLLRGRAAAATAAPLMKADAVVSSELIEVEIRRALELSWLTKRLDAAELDRKLDEALALLETFHLFPVGDEVLTLARPRFSVEMSVTSSIHIATAQLVQTDAGQTLQFWTHTPAVAAAAALRGLDVRGAAARA